MKDIYVCVYECVCMYACVCLCVCVCVGGWVGVFVISNKE